MHVLKPLMLVVFSSTELVRGRFHPASPLTTKKKCSGHARDWLSLGLLWSVGEEPEECQKSKRGCRAFYWRDNRSEIGEEAGGHAAFPRSPRLERPEGG